MGSLNPQKASVGDANHGNTKDMSTKYVHLVTWSIGFLWVYCLAALFFGEKLLGVQIRLVQFGVIIMLSCGCIHWAVGALHRRGVMSVAAVKNLAAGCTALLTSVIISDITYSMYINFTTFDMEMLDEQRVRDRHVWVGEAIPRRYYPSERDFMTHKPSARIVVSTYGDLYHPDMMLSPTVRGSVLERRWVSYSIDEHGFRGSTPLEEAGIFALGDSFVFGVGVTDSKTWVSVLEQKIGQPLYNLGVSGHSPGQQLMMLEYLFGLKADAVRLRRLLWMIYEGNDLEESYDLYNPLQKNGGIGKLIKGTIIDPVASIPRLIKDQSIINRLKKGRISLGIPFRANSAYDPYRIDGIRLVYPIYHSAKHGYRLFVPDVVATASQSESDVLDHPNRRMFEDTFKNMASLSRIKGFRVTVVIAPSVPRLYAAYFENFPRISKEPYFINFVDNLSRSVGFDVINLYPLMQPYAGEEVLYWRDDTHWNERGHEVVADLIAKHLRVDQSRLD